MSRTQKNYALAQISEMRIKLHEVYELTNSEEARKLLGDVLSWLNKLSNLVDGVEFTLIVE